MCEGVKTETLSLSCMIRRKAEKVLKLLPFTLHSFTHSLLHPSLIHPSRFIPHATHPGLREHAVRAASRLPPHRGVLRVARLFEIDREEVADDGERFVVLVAGAQLDFSESGVHTPSAPPRLSTRLSSATAFAGSRKCSSRACENIASNEASANGNSYT